MQLVRFDPFVGLNDIDSDNSRGIAPLWPAFPTAQQDFKPPLSYPAIDIEETEKEILLYADLPGVEKSDIEVQLHGNELSIAASRTTKHSNESNLLRMERYSGKWQRTFKLPETASDQLDATFKDGVLRIAIQKRPDALPRTIKVQ